MEAQKITSQQFKGSKFTDRSSFYYAPSSKGDCREMRQKTHARGSSFSISNHTIKAYSI